MTSPARSPRQTIEQLLTATISGVPGDMADCYAPQVTIEMPFAQPALYPSLITTTREELRARFQAGTAVRRYTSLSGTVIHETADPEVIVAEYVLHGEMTATGEAFSNRMVMVLTIRDGNIVHSRDYNDPIAGARVLGRLPELIASLG